MIITLNVRGYAGYIAPDSARSQKTAYYSSRATGTALNLELDLTRMVRLIPARIYKYFGANTYLFYDIGFIQTNRLSENTFFSGPWIDSGIGCTLTIKKWWRLDGFKPLTIRFDVPLYLNRPPAVQDKWKFRWIIGVNRVF
ncbi:MAG: hypothetical protein HY738_15805 [Bacteroidia bacterium]|nr:hypothetical protein [Bacteroidia bacterium]